MIDMKAISEYELLGLVYQIRYLNSKEAMTDEEIATYLKKYLGSKGIPVERVNARIIKR